MTGERFRIQFDDSQVAALGRAVCVLFVIEWSVAAASLSAPCVHCRKARSRATAAD